MSEERDCVVKLVDDHGVEHESPGGTCLRSCVEGIEETYTSRLGRRWLADRMDYC
jgi:hypothetical protein